VHISDDRQAAVWLTSSPGPWWQIATFGPSHFEAYARLRYVDDPAYDGQTAADLDIPGDHSDLAEAMDLLRVLARFTSRSGECYAGVWDGYMSAAARRAAISDRAIFEIENRAYILFVGLMEEIFDWAGSSEFQGVDRPPVFVWPADQQCCVASDIDTHWAGIGASNAAVDALVKHSSLDVVGADPSQRPFGYR
jgi:hypothetical protein